MVLEARKDAETVWYNIVWEEAKDASNVIDYQLNEEITKDASATENANNQTTTGMANVIPWINAPKLLYKTSIIWGTSFSTSVLSMTGSSFPANTASYFNQNTIVSWNDITLKAGYPNRIYLTPWLYIAYFNFRSMHTPTIEYNRLVWYDREDGWFADAVLRYDWQDADFPATVVFEYTTWYLYSIINPNSSLSWAKCTATFVRLW